MNLDEFHSVNSVNHSTTVLSQQLLDAFPGIVCNNPSLIRFWNESAYLFDYYGNIKSFVKIKNELLDNEFYSLLISELYCNSANIFTLLETVDMSEGYFTQNALLSLLYLCERGASIDTFELIINYGKYRNTEKITKLLAYETLNQTLAKIDKKNIHEFVANVLAKNYLVMSENFIDLVNRVSLPQKVEDKLSRLANKVWL